MSLTDKEIEDGWHKTFSTSNPYCPCDLKSFTKAARWAEHHVEAMKRIAAAPVAQGLDVDAVMTKIQEFASTWAVVGGRFDDGTAMECAEECKAEIRAILAQAAADQTGGNHGA